jgi:hypothetical protein
MTEDGMPHERGWRNFWPMVHELIAGWGLTIFLKWSTPYQYNKMMEEVFRSPMRMRDNGKSFLKSVQHR